MSVTTILELLPAWGPWLCAVVTFLSCLMVPIPASLVMMAAGAFSATGDLSLPAIAGAALAGAILGDGCGYILGARLSALLARRPHAAALLDQAAAFLNRRGFWAVFLSRWLFSPLGPSVNVAAGASGMAAHRFFPPQIAGEAVWVGLYIGLGHVFGAQYQLAADLVGAGLGFLAAGVVALALGRWLWRHRGAWR